MSLTTFDSTKHTLKDLLKKISEGKLQLPDFQRGWVWDDDHIQSLLVSIARSFPIGAVMLLETGGKAQFQVRPVEGLNFSGNSIDPQLLILDGQQRLTSLTQAIATTEPVDTQTDKGKKIKRHYYFDIQTALEGPERLEDALVAIDENRKRMKNFGREVDLDLSTRELECTQLYFPCDQILNSDKWEVALHQFNPDKFGIYLEFRNQVMEAFRAYQLPIIELKKETSKEAVCLVFEKVNTGGVQLSVFELVTASYAAEGYNLRDDWFGSELRGINSRRNRLTEYSRLLINVESTDFLQAITLLFTLYKRREDIRKGKQGKQISAVSAKRAAVLDLPLDAYRMWADKVEIGFTQASRFLKREGFYSNRELPYQTQLVPLAAILTEIGNRWLEPRIYEKISQWFWSGVLGELYGGSTETRIANDLLEVLQWIKNDDDKPRTVKDAVFDPNRLDTLRSRQSAAYKGISILVIRKGAKDFFWKSRIFDLDKEDVNLDIHHIFPKAWCDDKGIKPNTYNSIINKTPISYKANRKIGGDAPSIYLDKIQNDPQVQSSNQQMDEILNSHFIPSIHLRTNDFYAFYEERKNKFIQLIENVMQKESL